MPDYTEREQEALDTYQRYLDTWRQIDAGEQDWKALAAFFTDDATFIDPAWGRVEGHRSGQRVPARQHARSG